MAAGTVPPPASAAAAASPASPSPISAHSRLAVSLLHDPSLLSLCVLSSSRRGTLPAPSSKLTQPASDPALVRLALFRASLGGEPNR
ncbi:hypothetical protein NFJ02_09g140370 [Pycnococcus provasolii]